MATKPKLLSAAEISAQRIALQAQLDALANQEAAAKQEEANKLGVIIDSFPSQLAKILGRDVSMEDMFNMVRYKVKNGNLANHSADSTVSADRGKRLTDEQKVLLRADMLKRGIALKLGQPAEQMTVIAARHGCTPQTCDSYKPTPEMLAAELLKVAAVPAPAAAPATTPAS